MVTHRWKRQRVQGTVTSSPLSQSLDLSFWSHTDLKTKPGSITSSLTFQNDGPLKGKTGNSQSQERRGDTGLTKENLNQNVQGLEKCMSEVVPDMYCTGMSKQEPCRRNVQGLLQGHSWEESPAHPLQPHHPHTQPRGTVRRVLGWWFQMLVFIRTLISIKYIHLQAPPPGFLSQNLITDGFIRASGVFQVKFHLTPSVPC